MSEPRRTLKGRDSVTSRCITSTREILQGKVLQCDVTLSHLLPEQVRAAVVPWLAAFPGAELRIEPWSEYTPGPLADETAFRLWLADRAIEHCRREQAAAPPTKPEPEPSRLRAVCGRTPVEIRRDGTRWRLFAGAPLERVRPFATPFLDHARREAEARYGPATSGWRNV